MSFLWRLFRAEKPPDDYESVLAALATDIAKRQTLLSEIRARERKATTLVTLYTLAAWLAYLAVWYFGFVSGGRSGSVQGVERAVRALPVFVGPIFILFIRRIVQIWYNSKGNAEEKTLQVALKEQRAKVEEIKKKTNFYSTRDLLSRYDASAPGSPSPSAGPGPGRGGQPHTPQRGGPSAPQHGRPSVGGQQLQQLQNQPQQQQPQQPQQPPGPQQRKWFDALADLLVGAEEPAPAASQKYALICEKCFAHNGLVPEGMWEGAQYTCPKCGHFNPSARSKRLGLVSPISPLSVSQGPARSAFAAMQSVPVPVSMPASENEKGDGEREGNGEGVRRRGQRKAARDGEGEGEQGREEMMEVDS
ncbi:hypothetical protein C8R46DRAFT_996172 [Mycena filopes]|nr:hypothetical protein C8R46DRAFT_996172 [Mycena filopes]